MKKNNVILANAISIALGGFLFGYDIAMISGTTGQLEQLFDLNKFWLGFTVAAGIIGTIIGTMVIGKPVDRLGRRRILQVFSGIFAITALGSALSVSWYMLLFFRLSTGFLLGCISVVTPMFIAEISPAKRRGRLVVLNQFNVVAAIFLALVFNYIIAEIVEEGSWRWMIGVETIPAVVFFLLLIRVPESPRWLMMQGRKEDARKVFIRLKVEDPEQEVKIIEESMKLEVPANEAKLFKKANYFPIMIAVLLAAFSQLAGINAIFYYAPRIYEMTGLSESSSLLQAMPLGLTNLVFTFISLFLIDRFGRRNLLMAGSVGMVFFLGLIPRAFYMEDFTGYSVMIYLMGFIAFFAFSHRGPFSGYSFLRFFPTMCGPKGKHWVHLHIG